jgi:hypothetical protein
MQYTADSHGKPNVHGCRKFHFHVSVFLYIDLFSWRHDAIVTLPSAPLRAAIATHYVLNYWVMHPVANISINIVYRIGAETCSPKVHNKTSTDICCVRRFLYTILIDTLYCLEDGMYVCHFCVQNSRSWILPHRDLAVGSICGTGVLRVPYYQMWLGTPIHASRNYKQNKTKQKNSMVWVRERTIPTERPPLVGEVIANFYG